MRHANNRSCGECCENNGLMIREEHHCPSINGFHNADNAKHRNITRNAISKRSDLQGHWRTMPSKPNHPPRLLGPLASGIRSRYPATMHEGTAYKYRPDERHGESLPSVQTPISPTSNRTGYLVRRTALQSLNRPRPRKCLVIPGLPSGGH